MRTMANWVCVALVYALVGSCAHANRYDGAPSEHKYVARFWVEDTSLLPPAVILAACRYWESKGVICQQLAVPAPDRVRITVDTTPCGQGQTRIVPKADRQKLRLVDGMPDVSEHADDTANARAWVGGKIVVYASCLYRGGGVDEESLRATAAHEFGHQFGIWDHVPSDCDDSDERPKRHPNGQLVCGEAIMNPSAGDGEFITDMDALAFDLRDLDHSVLEPLTAGRRPSGKR